MVVYLLNLITVVDGYVVDYIERLEGSELYKTVLLTLLFFLFSICLFGLVGFIFFFFKLIQNRTLQKSDDVAAI